MLRNVSRRRAATFATVAAVVSTAAAFAVLAMAATPSSPVAAQGGFTVREAQGMEIVGHSDLGQDIGGTSDIWVLGQHAFLGYFGCGNPVGSSVVDVSDPTNPTVVFQTTPMSVTFANDVKALHMDTPAFTGDVFFEPHDRCARDQGPPAEMRIWDVTGTGTPKLLSSLVTGDGVHNSYPFQRGDNAYILLAAPYGDWWDFSNLGFEDVDLDADFAVVDVTDPTQPAVVGKWNAHDELTDLPSATFLHDVWANAAGTLAYADYWDAGLILLDISDVTAPHMVGRLTYPAGAEGNTHASVPLNGEQYLAITDEDFSPTDGVFEVLAPPAIAGTKAFDFGSFGGPLEGQPPMTGDVVYVGRGCPADPATGVDPADPYESDPSGKIAAVLRGACSFSAKVLRAEAAGATAVVIINNNPNGGPVGPGGWDSAIQIPAVGISLDDGNAITNTLAAGMVVTVKMGITPGEWGFTRIADISDPANPQLVGEYTIPQTRMYPPADGNWSVHNPWVMGDTLYLSHYWAGVRMVDVSDPTQPVELGHLIPGDLVVSPTEQYHASVWGVITDEAGRIYASDMINGLWIMQPASAPAQTATPSSVPPTPTPTATVATSIPPQQTATPTVVPMPTPGGAEVCPHIQNGKVPAAAIAVALANPGKVAGYNQPNDPSKPVHEIWNPRRLKLSIRAYSKPYHPLFNPLVFKAGCP